MCRNFEKCTQALYNVVEASVIGIYYKGCIKLFLAHNGNKRVAIILIYWHKMNTTCIIVA